MSGRGETIQSAQEETGVLEAQVHVEEQEIIEDEPQETEPTGPESVEETVKRALEETKNDAEEPGQDANAGNKNKAVNKGETAKKSSKNALGPNAPALKADNQEGWSVPSRLSDEEKKIFNAMPQELKPAVARMFKQHEALMTKTQMEAKRLIDENQQFTEVVKKWTPQFRGRNLNPVEAFEGLAKAHAKLTDPNPTTRKTKWLEIGASIGIEPEILTSLKEETGLPDTAGISAAPEVRALQDKIASLESTLSGFLNKQQESEIAPVVEEGRAIANEVDNFGQYLYPELRDATILNTRVRPLVSAMAQAIPDLSYGDALRRAVAIIRGESGNLNQSVISTARPTTATAFRANTQQNRAPAATASVRGRSVGGPGGTITPAKIPNDVHDTVRLALNNLRKGVF
jgi:hypothetical protein